MPLMNEAIDREDWERQDKGLPPLHKKKIVIPEQKLPKIDNHLKLGDIPIDRVESITHVRRKSIVNENGVRFIGYDVVIIVEGGRKAGRPPKNEEEQEHQSKTISGWMIEGDFQELFRFVREKVDLSKIAW